MVVAIADVVVRFLLQMSVVCVICLAVVGCWLLVVVCCVLFVNRVLFAGLLFLVRCVLWFACCGLLSWVFDA